ncbi:uncharacterized protein PODANS_1_11080 [Podospora anserina S mat+]|uniref:Podospora anserina S mat+ genomic DNA chromosome 1, supercontig 2 n=1 Tax=Podospora anserina (strain S / ATCC MYA-4624 / DSM 980 / FGSC 10383) TaxID=515849 RepID=B2AYH0_PODAN|nr:uncharacterized protein PODANS_1_11080 [Podospora anserina S mat+]CAP69444.1 unnamed protein product [Podospora anserina S mat+]CDP23466.1 Putative protein of unknown function [Podospora anserina S mat+]
MSRRTNRPPSTYEDTRSIRSQRSRAPANHGSQRAARPAEADRQSLRPPAAETDRYSLREHFAATRSVLEFDFDDASSFVGSTLASEHLGGEDQDDDEKVAAEREVIRKLFADGPLDRSYYELMCLPKKGPALRREEVQAAYNRLVQVLAVERQSGPLQSPAGFYLGMVQAAYEVLADPSRRIGYDLSTIEGYDSEDDEAELDVALLGAEKQTTYESKIQDQYILLTRRDARATTDLGFRVNASPLLASSEELAKRGNPGVEVLDFSLQKSATVALPGFKEPFEEASVTLVKVLKDFFEDSEEGEKKAPLPEQQQQKKASTKPPIRFTDPTLTITGSVHGLLDDPIRLAPLVLDHYQPPGPSIHSRRRLDQLLSSRFLPALNLSFRQEMAWRDPRTPQHPQIPDLILETDVSPLPHPTTSLRVGHTIPLLHDPTAPINVELFASKIWSHNITNFGLAAHKRVGADSNGTAFLIADSGDFSLLNLASSRPKECADMTHFSRTFGSRSLASFTNPPTLEVGYSFAQPDLGIHQGKSLTRPSARGLSVLDADLDENKPGSWTISTGFTPGNIAAYLRYGRDFFSSYLPGRAKGGIRGEVELAGTVQKDFYLAFRALKSFGRFSKAGLEVGLSPFNLHLSLYWSRLGQRFSLPFLMASGAGRSKLGMKVLFWSTVFPFAALAACELYKQRQRQRRAVAKARGPGINPAALRQYINKRRTEADELTVILATGAEGRQREERQKGGLVILSAKYGVRNAPPEEVADVTIALAALVDDWGRLHIPRGVKKGKLLGFWDPNPMAGQQGKVLRVRYLWGYKEYSVEVEGREELRLP